MDIFKELRHILYIAVVQYSSVVYPIHSSVWLYFIDMLTLILSEPTCHSSCLDQKLTFWKGQTMAAIDGTT